MTYSKSTSLLFLIIFLTSCKKEIPSPVANFTFLIEKNQISIQNTSTNSISYDWDFGDGLGKSTEKEPIYIYKLPGTYKITLKVLGLGGESQSNKNVNILPIKPKANFSYNLLLDGEVQLKNESLDADKFIWEIEGFEKNTLKEPKVKFPFNGKYKIKLKAEGFGAFDEIEQEITVSNTKERPPIVNFIYQDLGQGKFKFTNKSQYSNSYSWNFGDGKGKSTLENPEYTFLENGSYKVNLTCNGIGGVTSKDSIISVTSSVNYYTYILENKSNFTLIAFNNDKNKPLQNFEEVSISPNSKISIRAKSDNGITLMLKSTITELTMEYSTLDNKTYILNAYQNLYEVKFTGTCEPITIVTNIKGLKETYSNIPLPHTIGVKNFTLDILEIQSFKNNVNGFLNVFIYFKGTLLKTETISDPFSDILIKYDTSKKQFNTKETSPEEWYCGAYNGNKLITGPKGGCYYINGNGNKTYVDRSFCSCN